MDTPRSQLKCSASVNEIILGQGTLCSRDCAIVTAHSARVNGIIVGQRTVPSKDSAIV